MEAKSQPDAQTVTSAAGMVVAVDCGSSADPFCPTGTQAEMSMRRKQHGIILFMFSTLMRKRILLS